MVRILLTAVILSGIVALSAFSFCSADEPVRNFAIELEYGAQTTTFLPLNDNGQIIYGSSVFTTPLSLGFVFSAAPKINLGLSFFSSSWTGERYYHCGPELYENPRLDISSISTFFDLTPFMFRDHPPGITRGFFLEAGPSHTTISESYKVNGSSDSFSVSGIFLDIRAGFRVISSEPLALVVMAKASLPIAYDNNKSYTGISLNGTSILSIHAGACYSF